MVSVCEYPLLNVSTTCTFKYLLVLPLTRAHTHTRACVWRQIRVLDAMLRGVPIYLWRSHMRAYAFKPSLSVTTRRVARRCDRRTRGSDVCRLCMHCFIMIIYIPQCVCWVFVCVCVLMCKSACGDGRPTGPGAILNELIAHLLRRTLAYCAQRSRGIHIPSTGGISSSSSSSRPPSVSIFVVKSPIRSETYKQTHIHKC